MDEATDLTTQATFFNQGQVCTAGSRVLVQESAYDAYMEKAIAKAKARSAVVGDPFKKDTAQGAQGTESNGGAGVRERVLLMRAPQCPRRSLSAS